MRRLAFACLSIAALSFMGCPSSAGPQGPEGPAGPQGPKGDKGDPGEQGVPGPQGEPGMVLVVDGGVVTGPQGVAGPAGPSPSVATLDGGVACPTGGVRIVAVDGGVFDVCNGVAGPAGAAGPMGPAGATGPAGPAGAQGAAGPAGATGATGPMGPAGPAGATGATGTQGPAGMTGPAGPQGNPGPQGPPGPAGSGSALEEPSGFAGFTVATFNGNIMNGRVGAHAACAAEFSGAHFCHASEYLLANSVALPPATGAWIDASTAVATGSSTYSASPLHGRAPGSGCGGQWNSSSTGSSGPVVYPTGFVGSDTYAFSNGQYCATSRSLACCNGTARVAFRGFTTQTFNGNITNGRVGAHAACAAQFAGSHFCHAAEYLRANSAVPVPASGAWIDASASLDGSSTYGASTTFGRATGGGCGGQWNSASTGSSGPVVYPTGFVGSDTYAFSNGQYCATPRPLACCE